MKTKTRAEFDVNLSTNIELFDEKLLNGSLIGVNKMQNAL